MVEGKLKLKCACGTHQAGPDKMNGLLKSEVEGGLR